MPTTDPLADLLARIRNGLHAKLDQISVPASRIKLEIARILKSEGYLQKYEMIDDNKQGTLRLTLRYGPKRDPIVRGLKRISRPGLRVYVGVDEIPRIMGGMGTVVLSTSQGLLTGREARRRRIGGEVICAVW
ncbi:30S ribosomal protein S8 [candidate division KD3-62 bacterium DG_56]|uniref:Small ribosomal subunit protein uS8 n=1 Tax=candidate division KD3-62 bacterium DG_56 TaxID=1704032 RepID=A0A0S7XQF4_9BACT|nr:MAG: 30S ribosomal protein S8 [candidate division KD3-62 bacterium DG_56]